MARREIGALIVTPNTLIESIEKAVLRAREMDASLNERLTLVADEVRVLSAPFADAVDRMVGRLAESGAGVRAPAVGEEMPPFVLPDETGRLVTLDELLAEGPAAITFHRGYWCPYCRINTAALAAVHREARALGGQIVGIAPERQKFTAALKSDSGAPFPMLTDIDNGYALTLNLTIWVGSEMAEMMAGAGVDLPAYQGNEAWMLPIPATFVVGSDGIVVARHVDPDYRKGMETEDLLAALKAARR